MPEKVRELNNEEKAEAIQGLAITLLPRSPSKRTSLETVTTATGTTKSVVKQRLKKLLKYLGEFLEEKTPTETGPTSEHQEQLSLLDKDSPNTLVSQAAKRLLANEGYDMKKPADVMQVEQILRNAVETYERFSGLDWLDKYPDLDIRKSNGTENVRKTIYRIFRTATRDDDKEKSRLACTILRYALATDYRKKEPRLRFMEQAETYIERKLKRNLFKEKGAGWRFPDDPNISVIDIRHRMKSDESMDRKLLTHPEARAEEIMDSAGVTVICGSYADILKLVTRLFFDPNTTSLPAHKIRNERTRNKLFSEKFEEDMEHAKTDATWGSSVWDAIMDQRIPQEWIRPFDQPKVTGGKSLPLFRTLAITVDVPLEVRIQDKPELISIPVEIQFMTEKDIRHNEEHAPHDEYADRQVGRVMHRTTRKPILK